MCGVSCVIFTSYRTLFLFRGNVLFQFENSKANFVEAICSLETNSKSWNLMQATMFSRALTYTFKSLVIVAAKSTLERTSHVITFCVWFLQTFYALGPCIKVFY
mmetsp:Transcript_34116/g.50124  ORF Transcript_34116/g.50124 Transcript_34116/m.50124 type:complete len:104 (+) Transcript_34116:95-406(+)